jgi:DNA-binding IclR family transcriptional regulator
VTTGNPATVAGTQSIRRASAILREVAASGQNGVRLSELAQRTLLDHATVHRMLKVLLLERWLDRSEGTKRYVLGPLVFELGLCMPIKSDFRSAFEPALLRLAHESQDTVYLNVRSGLDFVCMAREEGSFPIRAMLHDVGGRRPLGIGASGIALLMELDPGEAALIINANSHRFRHYGLATREVAMESLRRSRELGYALSRDLDVIGLSAIGLPIHNAAGQAFAAISIAMSSSRLTNARCSTLASMMRRAIQLIEQKIM